MAPNNLICGNQKPFQWQQGMKPGYEKKLYIISALPFKIWGSVGKFIF